MAGSRASCGLRALCTARRDSDRSQRVGGGANADETKRLTDRGDPGESDRVRNIGLRLGRGGGNDEVVESQPSSLGHSSLGVPDLAYLASKADLAEHGYVRCEWVVV